MRELFAKLENPAVTGLAARFSDATADMTPAALPDLYRGEPLVVAAKLDKLTGSLEIKGRIGDRPWTVTLPLANAAEGKGLSKLWARRKISDAEVARNMRQVSPEESDKTILKLALEHQLVSRLTSLVAVDKTPSRRERSLSVRNTVGRCRWPTRSGATTTSPPAWPCSVSKTQWWRIQRLPNSGGMMLLRLPVDA